ncbi:hypothetical protein N7510_009384 [Penicillium lagena]|uniref:uncharacterized protein n=1 Tax=Penicillium lagena TaxID=94218 RepID=UPI0025405CCC|nr:uncharacterized protein N7510_009384 [Penicillium lagena]KAJ5606603.1 hypothetical protein N7510_009384 [Penicillium lagena]
MSTPSMTVPQGSWVLVTGATGFLASHIVKEFLERGYKVRGTVRDLVRAAWLNNLFKSYAERNEFELCLVPDLAVDHAFDDAVKGMSAIAHVATITSFDPDPHNVIPPAVKGVRSIMEAALTEPMVKELVFTSSFLATAMAVPGINTHVDDNTWNDTASQLAWAPPPYEPKRAGPVYSASKVASEKAVWEFVKEKNPHFTVNVISPAMILGEPLNSTHVETDYAWMKKLYYGDTMRLAFIPGLITVNVRDAAVLHVAAVLDSEVKNARLQAWGPYCNWNDILAIMRRLYPDHEFVPDLANMARLDLSTDLSKPLALLEKWTNQKGWSSLEEITAEALGPVVASKQLRQPE